MDRRHLLGILLVGILATATIAAEDDLGYGVRLTTGFETNPLRVTGAGPNGIFTDLLLDGRYRHEFGPRVEFFADADAWQRLYESGAADADYGGGAVRTGVALQPTSAGWDRLTLTAGGFYSLYRATYTDRATGEVFEVSGAPAASPSTVSIPDRLDYDGSGLFVDAVWNQNRRLRLFLKTAFDRFDYVEDYTGTTELDPLDYRSTRVEPGISWLVSQVVRLKFSVRWTDVDYDERPALDKNGLEVPDVDREYRYGQLRLSLRVTPTDRWKIYFGVGGSDRNDTYAGYYDYGSRWSYVAVDRILRDHGRIRLYGSLRDVDYDNATVTGEPEGTVLGNDVQRLLARYERGFRERLSLFVEGGMQRTDSKDPIYAYDTDWVLTGIQFRR